MTQPAPGAHAQGWRGVSPPALLEDGREGGVDYPRYRGLRRGEPVFDRLEADLGKAVLSLPASKGFEIGSGFAGTDLRY